MFNISIELNLKSKIKLSLYKNKKVFFLREHEIKNTLNIDI